MGLHIWLFMILLAITSMLIGFQVSGRSGLWVGFLISAFLLTLFFYFSTPQLVAFFNAHKVQGTDPDHLVQWAHKYARLLGVAPPDVYVFPSTSVTAFSLSPGVQDSLIAVSSELLRRLDKKEIEIVVGSQVAFIKSHSHFNFNLVSGFAYSFIGFAQLLDSYWPTNWRSGFQPSFRPFLTITLPIAGALLRFSQVSQKHFLNDETIALLTADKALIAKVLWKLDFYSQSRPLDILPGTNHFFMTNPDGFRDSSWFFESHPKIDDRIRRLAGRYPL